MLSNSQISKIAVYVLNLQDSEEKELLSKLINEYVDYKECGTPEECIQRKEWMSMSIDDIRMNFNSFVKEMRALVREKIKED